MDFNVSIKLIRIFYMIYLTAWVRGRWERSTIITKGELGNKLPVAKTVRANSRSPLKYNRGGYIVECKSVIFINIHHRLIIYIEGSPYGFGIKNIVGAHHKYIQNGNRRAYSKAYQPKGMERVGWVINGYLFFSRTLSKNERG